MEILIVLVFTSLVLVIVGLLFLFKGIGQGDYEHGDRLSLLPLEPDEGAPSGTSGPAENERGATSRSR